MESIRDVIAKYIKKKYKASPEYLWKRYPDYAVFRHEDNRKWFAIIMVVDADKLGLPGAERIDIIDVKIDDLMLRDILLQQEGFLPGYHMNKGSWITILLDGTASVDEICNMVDASFLDTASKKKKDKFRKHKEWLVPANPKYYDIEHVFDDVDEIDWKQGAGIIKSDTVFMYVGAPVSAILYKCSGIKEIMNDYKASVNITEDRLPTFFSDESDFNVTFWNLNYGVEQISSGESNGEVTEKSNGIINLNNTEKQIIELIGENSTITQKDLALQIGLSEGGIRKAMTKLKKAGIIKREGSTKSGIWRVVEDK